MRWEKVLLIVSVFVFLLAVTYSAVTFYRLRFLPGPKGTHTVPEKTSPPRVAKTQGTTVRDTTTTPDSDAPSDPVNRDAVVESGGFSHPGLEESASDSANEGGAGVTDATSEYPEVPPGYPFRPFWKLPKEVQANTPPEQREPQIVLDKVLIKLWKQGDRNFVSGVYQLSTGKVYPLYPNTIYIRWAEGITDETGVKKRYASRVFGTGDVTLPQFATEADIPPGVRVIDLDSEAGRGIDPYLFLAND